jgi:type III pantothenate kinase
MLLCDIGNTSYHFFDTKVDYKESVKTFNPKSITQKVYFISVNENIKKILTSLSNWIDLSVFIDTKNYYSTMGIDRIVACKAIDNGVIIDAGSAITVDVVQDGVFKGGFIYPGTTVMQSSYKDISSALDYQFNYDLNLNILPKNTRDAISYGYLKTLYSEVISYKKDIILTGGDALKLFKVFPKAEVKQTLIFDGMLKILENTIGE